MDRLRDYVATTAPDQDTIDHAFWGACHGGQRDAAEYLLDRGADLNWIPPWENLPPLDAARRNEFTELATWLRNHGARSTTEPKR
jgi:hypothetical protein